MGGMKERKNNKFTGFGGGGGAAFVGRGLGLGLGLGLRSGLEPGIIPGIAITPPSCKIA